MVFPEIEAVRKEVWGFLGMPVSHYNVEREKLHELYREKEEGMGQLPD